MNHDIGAFLAVLIVYILWLAWSWFRMKGISGDERERRYEDAEQMRAVSHGVVRGRVRA